MQCLHSLHCHAYSLTRFTIFDGISIQLGWAAKKNIFFFCPLGIYVGIDCATVIQMLHTVTLTYWAANEYFRFASRIATFQSVTHFTFASVVFIYGFWFDYFRCSSCRSTWCNGSQCYYWFRFVVFFFFFFVGRRITWTARWILYRIEKIRTFHLAVKLWKAHINADTYIRIGRVVIARWITVTVTVVAVITITAALYMMALVIILTKFSIQLIWIGDNGVDWIASVKVKRTELLYRHQLLSFAFASSQTDSSLTVIQRHYIVDSVLEIGQVQVPMDSMKVLLVDGSFAFLPLPVFEWRNSASPDTRADSLCDYIEFNRKSSESLECSFFFFFWLILWWWICDDLRFIKATIPRCSCSHRILSRTEILSGRTGLLGFLFGWQISNLFFT